MNENTNLNTPKPRYHFMTDLEAQSIPPAKWLIDGILFEETLAITAAPGESGKTLLVLDMCMCVATGRPWNGRKVRPGAVAYISAEGRRGFGQRIKAWKKQHGIPMTQSAWLYPLFEAVPLLDVRAQAELREALRELPQVPSVVVIDTLSQCTTGVDENTAQMASAIAAADRIKTEFHCTVIILHHSTKDGSKMRGHSSLRDNVDTQILLEKDDNTKTVTVKCGKQRDEDHFAPFTLQFKKVYLNEDETESSAVLVPCASSSAAGGAVLNTSQRKALAALVKCCNEGDSTATFTDWKNASKLGDTPFKGAREFLVNKGYAKKGIGKGKGVPYCTTQTGAEYYVKYISRKEDDVRAGDEDDTTDAYDMAA